MNTANKTMYETLAPVSELNRVPGFDPRKFIRKAVSEGKALLYLDLKFKKLWFRLAYPKGRIKKTALKITEQIAIIEARIFFDKDDAEPVASFIAQRNANGRAGSLYIESAQYAAENQVLIDAGFGLQFCDVSQGDDAELFDAGIPVSIAVSEDIPAGPPADTAIVEDEIVIHAQVSEIPAPAAPVEAPPAEQAVPAEPQNAEITVLMADNMTEATVEAESPAAEQQETVPAPLSGPQASEVPVADTDTVVETSPSHAVLEVIAGGQQDTVSLPQQEPAYTADMPVDEILTLMTPEGAAAVVVDNGMCKGWTLADVAEKRPASLKWYLNGYTGSNNLLRAGATLLLGRVMEKLAG
jgi:hypothetical protein